MVVVGTWNLENLYRPGGQFGPKDQATYDAKLTTLAATITAAAPDVLAVQEVGDPAALDDLVARLPGAWTTTLSNHPDARGIRVGFLTRTAPTASFEVVDFPPPLRPVLVGDGATDVATGMGRGAVHIHLDDLGGAGWDLLTVHLKSKLLSFPGGRFNPVDEDERARFAAYALYRRAAEAATVRVAATGILGGHGQDRRLVVLGDLNDTERPPPPNCCTGRPGRSTAPAGSPTPTEATGSGCGTWPRRSRRSTVIRASSKAAGVDRSHPDQPRSPEPTAVGGHQAEPGRQHHRQPRRTAGRTGLRSRPCFRPIQLTSAKPVRASCVAPWGWAVGPTATGGLPSRPLIGSK